MIWIHTLVLAVGAVTPRLQELQPKTYASPSGRWTLRVEPTERSGTAEADDTLMEAEREVWRVRHSFALREAIVTDDGRVAGVACSGEGPESWSGGGVLRVVVLAPTGEVLLDEEHEREGSRFEHSSAWPRFLGLFAQPELGRAVVRVEVEEQVPEGWLGFNEVWWAYDLASGKRLAEERPRAKLGVGANTNLFAARSIPGTPLVLLHWAHDESATTPHTHGALFQLVDEDWNVAWSLLWPHDYEGGRDAPIGIWIELEEQGGAILDTGPRRFELRQVAERRRITFQVEPTDAAATRWSVKETSAAAYDGATPSPSELPARTLELVKRVPLGQRAPTSGEIRDIQVFGFDERSRLRFVRDEPGTDAVSLVLLDDAGSVLRATRASPAPDERRLDWFALPEERWLAVAESHDERAARLWLVSEVDGRTTALSGFSGQRVERVVVLDTDTLLVLGTWETTSTLENFLVALDLSGRMLWRYPQGFGDLAFVDDVTVTTDRRIVALNTVEKSLQLLSTSGRWLETIELARAWGHPPRYPSVISADRDGGVLVFDFGGSPPLHRTRLDGTPRATFDVRRDDGTVLDECRSDVRVAPDGRLWTTDRHQLLRLDETGRVELALGSAERVEQLEEPGAARVDSLLGRVLVHDQRTRAVHVFDAEGACVALCRPRAEEREAMQFPRSLVVAPNGWILASESDHARRYVSFDAEGKSRGARDLRARNVAFAPSGEYWGVVDAALERHGTDGKLVTRVEKLPDGRWFRAIHDVAIDAEGALAVLDQPTTDGIRQRPGEACVALFEPDGRPVRVFSVPPGVGVGSLSYRGQRVLLAGWERAWLLDLNDGAVTALTLAEEARAFGLSPDGSELWAVAKDSRSFARYRLD